MFAACIRHRASPFGHSTSTPRLCSRSAMKRVSARFGMEVSTSGCSHSSDAAMQLQGRVLGAGDGMRPSSGPFPRIVSLSMRPWLWARIRRRQGALPANPRRPRAFRRYSSGPSGPTAFRRLRFARRASASRSLAPLGGGGRFWRVFRGIPRHDGLSNTSPSHWEGFPLCGRLRFARNAAVAQW